MFSTLKRAVRFVQLYRYAQKQFELHGSPDLEKFDVVQTAVKIFLLKTGHNERRHSVMVFVLDAPIKWQEHKIVGPLGDEVVISTEDEKGIYRIDTWGHASEWMIENNPELQELLAKHGKDKVLQFAGVRSIFGFHIPPLNDPSQFHLVKR